MAHELVENNELIAYVISKAVCTFNNKLKADNEDFYTNEALGEIALGVLKELKRENRIK